MRRYLRPLDLCWGNDARRAIAEGRAGALGGSRSIAFSSLEIIERDGSAMRREVIGYGSKDARGDLLQRIEFPRGSIGRLSFERPILMGIVNVTPDSFSDGGLTATTGQAVLHGTNLAQDGAAIIDVGGESTRPGSEGVPLEEELARVLPVIEALAATGHVVSVDTRKSQVMRAAARAGASLVNDVSALGYDAQSMATAAELALPVVLMHARGDPKTMQQNPAYNNVALDVFDWLEARIAACVESGIPHGRIVVDPGIGFGKTFGHNLEILQQLTLFHGLGVPVMIGLSRKAFIGPLSGERRAGHRVMGSVGGAIHAALHGAHLLRVHDVIETRQALAVCLAAVDPELSGL